MDEPSQIHGANHRRFRHNADHPPKWAVEKYGFETTQNIMLDHIYLDMQAKEYSAEFTISWEGEQNPPVHDALHKINGIFDKPNTRIDSVEVEVKVRNQNGADICVYIPADEFKTYLPKEEFDRKASKRTVENREFDDWILVNVEQHGWRTGIPEPVSSLGLTGAIIGFLVWLVGTWIICAPRIPGTYTPLEESRMLLWVIWSFAMAIITVFHDNDKIKGWLMNSGTPLIAKDSNADNQDEEDEDDEFYEDFLITELTEEDEGYE